MTDEEWLCRKVIERTGCHPLLARTRIERWLAAVFDRVELTAIVRSADLRAQNAERFLTLVADGVKQGERSSQKQLQLPLLAVVSDCRESNSIPATKARARPATLAHRAGFILFPLARRHTLVARIATAVAVASTPAAGKNLLRGHLARVGRTLARKRVPKEVIEREIAALDTAVCALVETSRVRRRRSR